MVVFLDLWFCDLACFLFAKSGLLLLVLICRFYCFVFSVRVCGVCVNRIFVKLAF